MTKKRLSLNNFVASSTDTGAADGSPAKSRSSAKKASPIEKPKQENVLKDNEKSSGKKREVVLQTVYLPPLVHKQLRSLAFEEEKKMHDLLMEGLDLVFRKRGLKPFDELSEKKIIE